jgi:hypothetical protein
MTRLIVAFPILRMRLKTKACHPEQGESLNTPVTILSTKAMDLYKY